MRYLMTPEAGKELAILFWSAVTGLAEVARASLPAPLSANRTGFQCILRLEANIETNCKVGTVIKPQSYLASNTSVLTPIFCTSAQSDRGEVANARTSSTVSFDSS